MSKISQKPHKWGTTRVLGHITQREQSEHTATMARTAVVMMTTAAASATASQISLSGSTSAIRFGDGAIVSASCSRDSPVAKSMNVSQLSIHHMIEGGHVRVEFLHMPTTCAYSMVDEPCASEDDPSASNFFHCVWSAKGGGTHSMGPYSARTRVEAMGAMRAYLECPILAIGSFTSIADTANGAIHSLLSLSVVHYAPRTATSTMVSHGRSISYMGVWGGNSTQMQNVGCQSSCAAYQAKGYPSGIYTIQPDSSVPPFAVECDQETDGGGWIVLTTNRGSLNYWAYAYSSDNNLDKCGYDGLSTQTNGIYQHMDWYSTSDCGRTYKVTYYTGGVPNGASTDGGMQLSDAQMAAIRSRVTTLSSTSKLFGASCDDDDSERSHEVYAVDAAGQRTYLTHGAAANDEWWKVSYQSTSELSAGHLLPTSFHLEDERNSCDNGGGSLAGWTSKRILVKADPTAVTQPDCLALKNAGYTTSGIYTIQSDSSVPPFAVECDQETDGGGWIVLTTNRGSLNYWAYAYSSDNNLDKCGYDGLSTQTNGIYQHMDWYSTSDCGRTYKVTYYTGGVPNGASTDGGMQLSDAQMAAIRSRVTTLSSTSKLFGASCDDDDSERSHEVYAVDAAGQRTYLTHGAAANDEWWKVSYQSTSELSAGHLLPTSFHLEDERNSCDNGGGSLAGWTSKRILVK